MLDIGQSEDWISLQVALAPCLLGYGAIARQLHGNPTTKTDGNTYWPWILNYVADDYVQAVKTGSGKDGGPHRITQRDQANNVTLPHRLTRHIALLEKHAQLQSPSKRDQLARIFIHGTRVSAMQHYLMPLKTGNGTNVSCPGQMEIGFWEMFPSK